MEKKLVAKKKPKSQSKKGEAGQNLADVVGEALLEYQTRGETTADRDISVMKAKPKSRKRNVNFEEDVIDGFLILSYSTLEDLEADGPIKPGAILAGNEDSNPVSGITPTKKKREGKSVGLKTGKSVLPDGPKKKKNEKLPKKPKAAKTEKCKTKSKKGKDDNATVTKPDTPVKVISESENKPAEIIHNASEKFLLAPVTSLSDNGLLALKQVTEPPNHVKNEESSSKLVMNQNTPTTPIKENNEFPLPRKPLSDFSINAIQGMRGTTALSTSSSSESSGSSTAVVVAVSEETQTQTKSIATMTSDQKQDKSISPMEVIMRKETGFQFRRFEETKISASIGGFSPIKSSLSFDDTVFRKSLHHQIDLTGTSVLNNEKTKFSSTNVKGREILRRDSQSRSPSHHSDAPTPSSNSLSSSKESTKHQHQHQHIHQHQHSHSHQHFHPFGMVPNGVFPPSYYSGMQYLPPMSGSAPHSHIPKPIPKPGKWCSLHVKIAHYITKAQKEAERSNTLNTDTVGLSRSGPHAFQAVPSRSNYDREFPFHSAVRPHLSFSPKGMPHSGLLHGAFPRDPERHPYHLQGRPHPYFPGREGLALKRPDFEHPSSFSSLGHSGSSYRGLFDRERSSPPHLEAIFPRRNSERALTDIEKTNRLLHHDRSMLNLSSEREIHHESERHRRSSFMDRDKTAYFQPVKLDGTLCRSSLTSHGILGYDATPKPSPRRVVSPLSSSLVAPQKPHHHGNELFERFLPDSLEHRSLYGAESRLIGGESRLFGPESRLFGSENRILGGGDPRIFGSEKRIPAPENRLFGAESRKSLLPFGHNTPLSSSVSHPAVLGSLGRMSSKFTSSS